MPRSTSSASCAFSAGLNKLWQTPQSSGLETYESVMTLCPPKGVDPRGARFAVLVEMVYWPSPINGGSAGTARWHMSQVTDSRSSTWIWLPSGIADPPLSHAVGTWHRMQRSVSSGLSLNDTWSAARNSGSRPDSAISVALYDWPGDVTSAAAKSWHPQVDDGSGGSTSSFG